jgi:hypothetical protein
LFNVEQMRNTVTAVGLAGKGVIFMRRISHTGRRKVK